jgi:hypothetical protein
MKNLNKFYKTIAVLNELLEHFAPKPTCLFKLFDMKANYLAFIGIFHASMLSNIRAENDKRTSSIEKTIYITKSYKGSSISICQDMKQLKLNRCFSNIPLIYEFYGTGHIIYKNYMFYHHNGVNEIVVYNIADKSTINIVPTPEDAVCCDEKHSLYKMQHSGLFHFISDENGLYLIYSSKTNDVFVIAKINESNFTNLVIEKKWYVQSERENTLSLFITCGQLYAIKQQLPSMMITLTKLCNLLEDNYCSMNYSVIDLTILSSLTNQITFAQYNPDKNVLFIVDGGNFLNFKLDVSLV